MVMKRVQSVMTGVAGSPFVTTHYFRHVEAVPADIMIGLVVSFWNDGKPQWGANTVVRVEGDVAVVEETTGDVVDMLQGTGVTVNTASTQTVAWTGQQGLMNLQTDSFVGGRRTRGRLFLPAVPNNAGFQVPSSGYIVPWETAGENLIEDSATPGPWVVWSRTGGVSHTITGVEVPAKYAYLKSRAI